MVTYKVFQIVEPEVHAFLRFMRRAYNEHQPGVNDIVIPQDEVEATGTLLGVLVKAMLSWYARSQSSSTTSSDNSFISAVSHTSGGREEPEEEPRMERSSSS